jgi:hypothetical protein
MPTLSFDFKFVSNPENIDPPANGYSITLHGDFGKATRFETDCVLGHTPAACLKLRSNSTHSEPIEMQVKPYELPLLRSSHYTWSVQRNDGEPLGPAEVQFAFLMRVTQPPLEPSYVVPLSALVALVAADKTLSHAFIDALTDIEPGQREVCIHEQFVAAGLVDLGLIVPSKVSDQYALMDIELR